ncbi:MAG: DUF192 domain-containing protein [bacterium]
MRKIPIRYLILIFLITGTTITAENKKFAEQRISINGNILIVEIADTPKKRQEGLMYREKLDWDEGMLFIFEIPYYYAFWMKNTKIPLSLAFIDQEFKITEIVDLEPMDTTLAVPSQKISYVLEMNKGWFKKNNVKVGDAVKKLGL